MQTSELKSGHIITLWRNRIRLTNYVGLVAGLSYWWGETLDTREIEVTMVALTPGTEYKESHGTQEQTRQASTYPAEIRPSV